MTLDINNDEILALHNQGWTQVDIGLKVGCDPQVVRYRLKKLGRSSNPGKKGRPGIPVTIDGVVHPSMEEAHRATGIPMRKIRLISEVERAGK